MNAISLLLNQYWIVKDTNKQDYYDVKREINDKNAKRFVQEMLGWKLIHSEHVIKLEKIPAHAEPFMGIQEFTEIRDYIFLCAVLMFLEDKEDNSQFLLSDLIRYVETILDEYIEVDWTSFAQRKSIVRVLQFVENKEMLRVYEGDSSSYSKEQSSEVLYENTGLSRYFTTNFSMDITSVKDWRDFEKKQMEELDDEHGEIRKNRVYRQLVTCPSLYWKDNDDPLGSYLKNYKSYVSTNIETNIGGILEMSKNNASIVFVDCAGIGDTHPKSGMLSEIVLLVTHAIYEMAQDKRKLSVNEDDTISISANKFEEIVLEIKKQYQDLWSKEYREMLGEKYISAVKEYMKKWMMIEEDQSQIIIYPCSMITSGKYSNYLEDKVNG